MDQVDGTYNGSIIKTVELLCKLIAKLNVRLKDLEDNAPIPLSEMPEIVGDPLDNSEVFKLDLSEPKHIPTKKAKKGTARKANTHTKGDR